MEGNEQKYKIAYFRENIQSGQCKLNFSLETDLLKLEEICIDLQKSDTISFLILQIKSKLQKLLQDKLTDEEKENKDVKDIPVYLKRGGRHIRGSMLLKNFPTSLNNESKDLILLEVFDQKYVISLNAPMIKSLKLPSVLYANYVVQPATFFTMFTDIKTSTFIWYKSQDKIEWLECGRGFQYPVKLEDVDHYLKIVCFPYSNDNTEGTNAEAISESKVEVMKELPSCPFEKRHDSTRGKLQGFEFRVVSYNVLADRYTTMADTYNYCDPRFLAIDYRKQLILKELLGFNADIICLQEVDNRHYNTYFKGKFKESEYKSIYHRKGNRIPEGFAFIYKKTRYQQLESKHVVFGIEIERHKLFSYLWRIVKRNEDLRDAFVKMPTSLQITVLKAKEVNRYLIVGNTHFPHKPEATHVRLLQINMSTAYLDMLKRRYEKNGCDVAVILCGDFNSQPDKSLYQYMTQGKMDPSEEDCLKIEENGRAMLYHNFAIESACGTPKYTNYTPDFKGCLDYIFIETTKFTVQQVVPLTEEEELAKHDGLPNEYFPSDHLPLVVDLKFKKSSSKEEE